MMPRDRRTLLSTCLAGFFLMSGSAFFAWGRWQSGQKNAPASSAPPEVPMEVRSAGTGWPGGSGKPFPPVEPPAASPLSPPLSPPAAPVVSPAPVPVPSTTAAKRNIRFMYRNSRPRRVELVGSFNSWTPISMTKGENHQWESAFPLEPGEYTYNFLVDGKPVRDPNNPRTAPEGRSLLVIQSIQ